MNLNKLANSIHRGKFLMEPNFARGERARAIKFLSRDFSASEEDFEKLELEKPKAFKAGSYFDMSDSDDIFGIAETGSVAIIPICGTIMKYDFCGTPGTDTLSSWLKSAIASPQIDAIVLLINSGGGSVEGTGEFADLVNSSEKNILAFCDGIIASAAYWIGAAAKEIWVSHKTVEAGSIGVAASFFDDSKAMEEMGYQDVYINADTSPDKNMDYFDAIKGDYSGIKSNSLNPLDEIFMGTIKGYRGAKLKLQDVTINDKVYQEPLTGKMYLAETSISNGLIDGICTLEQCIEKVLEAKENNNEQTLKSNNMAVNTEEKEKQAKKSTSLLEKIAALFASESDSTIESDAEELAKKADDSEDEEAKKAKKSGDEDTEAKKADDMDDENDDDSDEDDVEVNGKTYSMKDPAQAKAALAAMTEDANKAIADRDALLVEANTLIAENVATLKISTEEIKKGIKSTFTLKGSNRANKIGVTDEGNDSQAFKPAADSFAGKTLERALAKQRAAAKEFAITKK